MVVVSILFLYNYPDSIGTKKNHYIVRCKDNFKSENFNKEFAMIIF